MNPPPSRGKKSNRGYRRWTAFNYRRNNNERLPRPISLPLNNQQNDDSVNSSTSSNSTNSVAPPVPHSVASFYLDRNSGHYVGWKLYFPEESFDAGSNLVAKIKAFEEHIISNATLYNLETARKRLWYAIDLTKITKDDRLGSKWPSFLQDLLESPEETLKCIDLAMHQRLVNLPDSPNSQYTSQTDARSASSKNFFLHRVYGRIQTNMKTVSIKSLKISNCGKLCSVRGNVIRVSSNENRVIWLIYRCVVCKAEQAIKQTNKNVVAPSSCRCKNRSASNFIPMVSSPFTMIEGYQTIRLQENVFGTQPGRVPRTIEIELGQDLVDSVCPGDDVTVTGILQSGSQDDHRMTGAASMYKIHLIAVSISSNRNAVITWKSSFSENDIAAIRTIKSEQCPFRLLVHSLSPSIYGHEMVKAGFVLGLLGGSDNSHRRSQCHVLVVGDPGVGKSQMLQACANASPKGIFVCGKTASSTGLTVTLHHEKDTSLGAGALMLADQGVCCIDEFDKMPNNHHALLEVMEQQCVSIAKAGVLCSLPARTSVFAAANPCGGHYDKSRTVSENIKMNPALLSRFDLVFIVLDRPDVHLDGIFSDQRNTFHNMPRALSSSSSSYKGNQSMLDENILEPLFIRLKLKPNETIDTLPQVLMQTYIAYARKYCHPKLSPNAANILRTFYLELRSVQQGGESIPVTTRQLEALVRLTQARARAELCGVATERHAEDVIAIVKYSMVDIMSTDIGTLQMERKVNGSGMSQTSQIKQFVRILQTRSRMLNKSIFSIDELREAANNGGLKFHSFMDSIETMNIQGFFLKKGSNLYKFLND